MTTRGIEVHNGHIILSRTINIEAEQEFLDQKAIIASLNASVLGGTIQALHGIAKSAVSMPGNIRCLRADAMILDGGIITDDLRGAYIRAVGRGVGEVAGEFTGLYVELNTDVGVVISGDANAIHIGNMMIATPVQQYNIIRLDENGGATIDNFISAHVAGGSDINYFLYTAQVTSAWSNVDDKTGGGSTGWIRVIIAGAVKYIGLY